MLLATMIVCDENHMNDDALCLLCKPPDYVCQADFRAKNNSSMWSESVT